MATWSLLHMVRRRGAQAVLVSVAVAVAVACTAVSFDVFATSNIDHLRGQCLADQGKTGQEACRAYVQGIHTNYSAIVQLGRQLESRELFKNAAAVYEQGLQYYPGHQDLMRRQQFVESTWKEAERLNEMMSGAAPSGTGGTDTRFAVIQCKRLSGAKAIEACQNAAAIDPGNPMLYQRLGDELTRLGRVAEANGAYQKARELGPLGAGGTEVGKTTAQADQVRPVEPSTPQVHPGVGAHSLSRLDTAEKAPEALSSVWSKALLAQLQMLDRIRQEGYINDSEYIKRKQQLLDAVLISQPEATTNKPDQKNDERHFLQGIELGKFHALLIGNNEYQHIQKLKSAVSDADGVGTLLEKEYGFRITKLRNANRYQILSEISRFRSVLAERDSLLIYYAGHGVLDTETGRGYWLPIDAEQDNYANWISTTEIIDQLHGMKALHVLIVADSCFSGTLLRGSDLTYRTNEDRRTLIQRLATKRSRTVLTSGGLEPVLDSGGGAHSVFTKAFLAILLTNEGVLEGIRLFEKLRGMVVLNAEQTPEYAPVQKAGHDGGDFVFVRRP